MPTLSFTNRTASQALKGQNVKVTLDATDAADLSSLEVGMQCQGGSFAFLGYISSVDFYGNSFEIAPAQLDSYFGVFGYLPVSETITVTL